MPPLSRKAAALRQQWERAVERDKPKDQLAALEQLEQLEDKEARWPHRRADVLRRLGRPKDAEHAYDRAMGLYEQQGFVARAVAVAKIIATLNPDRANALESFDHEVARTLRSQGVGRGPPLTPSPPLPAGVPPTGTYTRSGAPVASGPPPSFNSHGVHVPASFQSPASSFASEMPASPPGASSTPPASYARASVRVPPPAPTPPEAARRVGYVAGLPADQVRLVAIAMPLALASDAGPDEVRFDNLPEELSTDVDLSELVSPDSLGEYGPAAEEFDLVESPTAERLSLMSGAVLFADVPREVAQKIARAADLVDLGAGARLYGEGQPADSLYIVVDGAILQSLARAPGAGGELGEGEVFGEECLIEGAVRQWDVASRGALLALRIPKRRLDAIVEAHPQVGDVLFGLLIKRLVAGVLQTSPLFAAFDGGTRREVAALFEVRRAPEGTLIKRCGKRGDGMYILLVGNLELERDGDTTWLPPGSTFGQSSLFSSQPEEETVRVVSEAVLLRLPTSRFGTLATKYPPALAQIAALGPG